MPTQQPVLQTPDNVALRNLWSAYQLQVAPSIFLMFAAFSFIILVRNILLDYPFLINAVFTFITLGVSICGFHYKQYFQVWTRITLVMFIPGFTIIYIQSLADFPPPMLVTLTVIPLLMLFMDGFRAALTAFLLVLVTYVFTALRYAAGPPDALPWMLILAITLFMSFGAVAALYLNMTTLFKRHEDKSRELVQSLERRLQIRYEFFDAVAQPLADIDHQLSLQSPSSDYISQFTDQVSQVLDQARKAAMETTSMLGSPVESVRSGLLETSRSTWFFLASCGLACALVLTALDSLLNGTINFRAVMAIPVCVLALLLGRIEKHHELLWAIVLLFFAGLVIWSCAVELEEKHAAFQIMYFTILIFCSSLVFASIVPTVILILLGMGTMAAWFGKMPELPLGLAVLRSNILFALMYYSVVALLVRVYLKRLLNQAVNLSKKLQAETDSRYRLLATLFHDIANPLFTIKGMSELNSCSPLNDADWKSIRSMQAKIKSMLQLSLVADELERKGKELATEDVPVRAVLEDLKTIFADRLRNKNLTLHVEDSDRLVRANPLILTMSVMSNLLTNAIKFSPENGTITIRVSDAETGDTRITFEDEGAGIPEDVIIQLQNHLYVQSRPGTKGETGSGHGLRLASLYLNQMGGDLQFAGGSRIDVVIPTARPNA